MTCCLELSDYEISCKQEHYGTVNARCLEICEIAIILNANAEESL